MSTGIDRALPAELRQLIELAAASPTLEEMSLCHESLGADFFAPIGWLLHLDRLQAHLGQKHLIVMARPGQAPRALVMDNGDTRYLGSQDITAWITAALADTDTSPGATEQILTTEQLATVMAAADAGWQVSRRTTTHRIPTTPETTYVASRCDFTASNWHYNNPASEHHRNTGAPVSTTLCLSTNSGRSDWAWALNEATEQVVPSDILSRIDQSPPWAEPVAVFDEDLDDWIY